MGSQGLHQMQHAQAPKSLDKINHGNVLASFQILPAADLLNKDKSLYNNLYPLRSVEVIRFCILGLSLNLPGIILLLGDPRRPGEAYPPALRSISMHRTGPPARTDRGR